jgi:Na+/melibiose symporter-like transporter
MNTPADYFFYRVLQWRLTCKPVDRMPLLTTKMALAIVCFFNSLAILPWVVGSLPPLPVPAPMLGLLLIFVLLGAVHMIWITTGRYRTLDERFSRETPTQRKWRTWMIYIYVTLTIFAVIVSPILVNIFHFHRNGPI